MVLIMMMVLITLPTIIMMFLKTTVSLKLIIVLLK